jgi:glycosyltransferase involved in cell wall biosynthesis
LTSRYEGFSLVLLEAMRHGVPCITFDCPYGPKDLVDHNKCGFVIDNGNINKFAERLCYLMDHPEIRKQLSKAAIEKAQLYQVDNIMNQWKQLFESLK